MYWRVKPVTPEDVLKKYGVHLALAISLFANLILYMSRPNTNQVSKELKQNFDQFARNVTAHLLDTNYISWQVSKDALMHGELAPSLVQRLQASGDLPKSPDEIKAIVEGKTNSKEVSALRIDEVIQSDPNQNKFIPVEVKGVMAIHSADETGSGTRPFDLHFLMGQTKDQKPIVADLRD